MPVSPTQTKAKSSARKRLRNDAEEEGTKPPSEDVHKAKRANTSKTPVKSRVSTASRAVVSKLEGIVAVFSPSQKGGTKTSEAKATESKKEATISTPPRQAAATPKDTKVSSRSKAPPQKIEPTADTKEAVVLETNKDVVGKIAFVEELSRKKGRWIVLLVLGLVLASALCLYTDMTYNLRIVDLSQDLQNCKALQSHENKQNEVYIVELEKQIRSWRQQSKANQAELQVVKAEASKIDEDYYSLKQQLKDKDNQIMTINEQLEARSDELRSISHQLQEKDHSMQSMKQHLEVKEGELQAIKEYLEGSLDK